MQEDVIGTSALANASSSFLLSLSVFFRLSSSLETLHDPVQRPDVVRMLGAALDPAAQAKVVATNFLGFSVVALLRQ